MLEIFDVVLKPNASRIGHLNVRYHELVIKCDICLYKEEKLWIRMPEKWTGDRKCRFVYWDGKEISDKYQELILNKVFDMVGLDLPKGLEIKRSYWQSKKKADNNKENT